MNTQSVGKTSVAPYDSALRFRTEMMVTGETFVTVETTVGRPTNTDALADLESLSTYLAVISTSLVLFAGLHQHES